MREELELDDKMASGEGFVEALEEFYNLGSFMKEFDAWGQFLNLYRNLGRECIHTRTAAKLVFMDESFKAKVKEVLEKVDSCLILI